jgi:hypothetical protein
MNYLGAEGASILGSRISPLKNLSNLSLDLRHENEKRIKILID